MPTFDEAAYLKSYPDVAKHSHFGSRAKEHFDKYGKAEIESGRRNKGSFWETWNPTPQPPAPLTYQPIDPPGGAQFPQHELDKADAAFKDLVAKNQTGPSPPDAGQIVKNSQGQIVDSRTGEIRKGGPAGGGLLQPDQLPNVIDESTGINVGLGRDIRQQQALGAGNILTKTGATGVDPATGRFDPSKVEMLYDPEKYTIEDDELLTDDQKLIDPITLVNPQDISGVQQTSVTPQDASLINNIERTYSNVPTAVAAQGEITSKDVVDPNQVVDERTKQQMFERGSLSEAQTQTLAQEASTAYQIEQLTNGIETGNFPPWAAPTVRKANEIMNQRGLGASSMAAAAIAQAIQESAIPIAANDAQKAATLQIQNLNNQQQTALANAATIATMDRQNLDNRMKAAQQNAQSFLQMNLQNVSQEQASAIVSYQSTVQSLFTDQAAENARLQFNATSDNQVNQFYDQLGLTAAENNANRDVAIQKFNSEEQTAVNEFNANVDNARQVFNSQMQNVIDQSNVSWRRQINTTNTANENLASQQNAQVLLGLTVQAQNNLWQEYRDVAHQLYSSFENDRQRTHDIVVTGIKNQFSGEQFQNMLDYRASVAAGARINGYVENLIGPVIGRGIQAGVDKLFGTNNNNNTSGTSAGDPYAGAGTSTQAAQAWASNETSGSAGTGGYTTEPASQWWYDPVDPYDTQSATGGYAVSEPEEFDWVNQLDF